MNLYTNCVTQDIKQSLGNDKIVILVSNAGLQSNNNKLLIEEGV